MADSGSKDMKDALDAPARNYNGGSTVDRFSDFVDRHLRVVRVRLQQRKTSIFKESLDGALDCGRGRSCFDH